MPLAPADLQSRLALAVEAAPEAGRLTLEYFRRDDLEVELKCDDTPVTVADRRAEQHLRQRIAAAFPADGILGEEFSEQPGTSGCRWIIDPIDGTKSFIHGVPLYATLVAVEWENHSVLGVIHIPALDECVYAAARTGDLVPSRRAAAPPGTRLAAAAAQQGAVCDQRGGQLRPHRSAGRL